MTTRKHWQASIVPEKAVMACANSHATALCQSYSQKTKVQLTRVACGAVPSSHQTAKFRRGQNVDAKREKCILRQWKMCISRDTQNFPGAGRFEPMSARQHTLAKRAQRAPPQQQHTQRKWRACGVTLERQQLCHVVQPSRARVCRVRGSRAGSLVRGCQWVRSALIEHAKTE